MCVYLLFFNKPNQVGKRQQHTKAQRQILFCLLGARLAGVIYSFYSQLLKTAQRSWQIKYDKIRKQQRANARKEGKPERGTKPDHKQLDYDNNPRCSTGSIDRETRSEPEPEHKNVADVGENTANIL